MRKNTLKNLGSPSRRRAERSDDQGFLLNETAIWLVIIAIILGVGGYYGLGFITRTKSAAARQVLDNAVAVADQIYSQQINGRTTFFGCALNDAEDLTTPGAATKVATSSDNAAGTKVKAIEGAWAVAGEGIAFKWWPAIDLQDDTWHKALTDNPETVHFYINAKPIDWDEDGAGSQTAWSIPAGQMLRMATADSDGNTYCAIYIRQVITDTAENAADGFDYVGVGYQSYKAATPGKRSATNKYQSKYADCGMEAQVLKTDYSGDFIAWTTAKEPALEAGTANAELPGTDNTRSTLGDPE